MTALFDGLAGLLNDVFGAPVTHTAPDEDPRVIQAVFREAPETETDREGYPYLVIVPTLRVLKADAVGISHDDIIEPGNGSRYLVKNRQPDGSPAADAFVVFELEKDLSNV